MPFAQRTTHESEIPAIHEQLLSFVVNPLNATTQYPLFIAPVDLCIADINLQIAADAPSTATTAKLGCAVPGTAYATSQDIASLGAMDVSVPAGTIAWTAAITVPNTTSHAEDATFGAGVGLTNPNSKPQARNCVRKGELVFVQFSATASGACFNITLRINTIKEFGGAHRTQRSVAVLDTLAKVAVARTAANDVTSTNTLGLSQAFQVPPITDQDILVPLDTCNYDNSVTALGLPILVAPYDLVIEEVFIYSETTPPGTCTLRRLPANGIGSVTLTSAFTITNTATAAASKLSSSFLPLTTAQPLASGGAPKRTVLRAGEYLTLHQTVAGAYTAFGAVCIVIRVSSPPQSDEVTQRVKNSDWKEAQPALIMTGGLSTARTPLLISDRAYVIERMYVSGHASQTSTAMQLALGPDAAVAGSNNPISADIDVTSASRAEASFERTAAVGLNPGGDFLPTAETGIPNLNVVEAGNVLWFRNDDGGNAIQAGHRLSVGLLVSTVTRDLIPRAAV